MKDLILRVRVEYTDDRYGGLKSVNVTNIAGGSTSLTTNTYDIDGCLDLLTYPSLSANLATDDIVIKHGYQNGALKSLTNNKSGVVYR